MKYDHMEAGGTMTSVEREKFEVLQRQAKLLREVWLRMREERRAGELAANAEVRRRWVESNSTAANLPRN
jgi:hypothetical protein